MSVVDLREFSDAELTRLTNLLDAANSNDVIALSMISNAFVRWLFFEVT
jgi:hypothetical protein